MSVVADASRLLTYATGPHLGLTGACTGFTAPQQQAKAGHLVASQQASEVQMMFCKILQQHEFVQTLQKNRNSQEHAHHTKRQQCNQLEAN